jgi:hypothetical protein
LHIDFIRHVISFPRTGFPGFVRTAIGLSNPIEFDGIKTDELPQPFFPPTLTSTIVIVSLPNMSTTISPISRISSGAGDGRPDFQQVLPDQAGLVFGHGYAFLIHPQLKEQLRQPLSFLNPSNRVRISRIMSQIRFIFPPGYGPVISVNRPVRTHMPGGVGVGGEKPPATRLYAVFICNFIHHLADIG